MFTISRSRVSRLGVSVAALLGVAASLLVATPAIAEVTGTGGLFVPTTARILDTAAGIGSSGAPLPAGEFHTIQVAGVDGIPDDGSVGAISLVATVADITGEGQLLGRPSADARRTMLGKYGGIDDLTTSLSAVLAVSDEGTIDVHAQTSVNLTLDVQGYYTTSSDGTAPGGFVPIDGRRIVDTRSGLGATPSTVAPGETLDVQVTGLANAVPAGASGVIVNLLAVNETADAGYLTPYQSGTERPAIALHYQPKINTSVQAQVGLSEGGKFTIYNANAVADIIVDLQGYFTAVGEGGASFTPGSGRLYDSRTSSTGWFTAGETRSIPIAGFAGVPDIDSRANAAVLSLTSLGTTSGTGRGVAWADGTSRPDTTAISSAEKVMRSNTITVPLGANGAISLQNFGNETHYIIDLQGWYTPPEPIPGPDTLSLEQIERLSDEELQAMLDASATAVEDAQNEYEETASAEDHALAVQAYAEVAAELDGIIESEGVSGLRTAVDAGEVLVDGSGMETLARCFTVYKWQLQTIAWILIGYGTFVSIAALFASGTVIGLPLGAVAGAAGVTLLTTAYFFLWKVDQQRWTKKRVCF